MGIILDSDSSQVITQQQHPVYRLSIAVAVAMAVLVVMAMLQ